MSANKKRWLFPSGAKHHIVEKAGDVWIISAVNEVEKTGNKYLIKAVTPAVVVKEKVFFDSYPIARRLYEEDKNVTIIVTAEKE